MARWGAIFGGFGGAATTTDAAASSSLLIDGILAPIAATLIQLAISRTREYQADASGAQLTHNPLYLASALRKLEAANERMPLDAGPATAHLFIVNPLSAAGPHGGSFRLIRRSRNESAASSRWRALRWSKRWHPRKTDAKGFKVQDRRRFSSEGELKPEFSGADEPAAAKPDAATIGRTAYRRVAHMPSTQPAAPSQLQTEASHPQQEPQQGYAAARSAAGSEAIRHRLARRRVI